jgi:hypothetical protein
MQLDKFIFSVVDDLKLELPVGQEAPPQPEEKPVPTIAF